MSKNHYQLTVFHHHNDRGTKFLSSVIINQPQGDEQKMMLAPGFFSNTYLVNPLVDELDDVDLFRKNINSITLSLSQLKSNKNLLMCMRGDLFNGNSLIKGIKLINFKL